MWIQQEEKPDYMKRIKDKMELVKRNSDAVLDEILRIRGLIYWLNAREQGTRSKNATIRRLDNNMLQASMTVEKAIKMIEKCDKELVPEFEKLMRMREMQEDLKKSQ